MRNELIQQAHDLLSEMKQQAEAGTMIPFRVPGQIDAITALPVASAPGKLASRRS